MDSLDVVIRVNISYKSQETFLSIPKSYKCTQSMKVIIQQ